MRIIEICPFSSGVCGVFTRAFSESQQFTKLGHEVLILSSDMEKGTGKINPIKDERIENVSIRRFPSKNDFLDNWLSDNVIHWFSDETERQILDYNPDIIITHLLHPHSAKVCKMIPELKKRNPSVRVFIVPHAPFNIKRKFPLNILTYFWRKISLLDIKRFDKIIAITKWENPYLLKMGAKLENIIYIPNGLPNEYLKIKKNKPENGKEVLFLGRVAPVKDIETLLKAAKLLPEVNFSIIGPQESEYMKKIEPEISKLSNVILMPPIYKLKDKIKEIDSHKIFVLPSKREAMPQVLLEAMSRGKTVISSATDGGKEIIADGNNGFLFPIGDYTKLVELINSNLKSNSVIQKQAVEDSKKYKWEELIKGYGI